MGDFSGSGFTGGFGGGGGGEGGIVTFGSGFGVGSSDFGLEHCGGGQGGFGAGDSSCN
jgi:hypothetical protein